MLGYEIDAAMSLQPQDYLQDYSDHNEVVVELSPSALCIHTTNHKLGSVGQHSALRKRVLLITFWMSCFSH